MRRCFRRIAVGVLVGYISLSVSLHIDYCRSKTSPSDDRDEPIHKRIRNAD